MTEFSVNTHNRFALGLEDEEDTDLYALLDKEEETKKKKAQEAEQAAKQKADNKGKKDKRNTNAKTNTKKILSKSTENTSNTQQRQPMNDNSFGKKPTNTTTYDNNRTERAPRFRNQAYQNRSSNDENQNFERPPQENRDRRDGPGMFRGRGGRGGRGGFGGRGRGRDFDRHSGSDKTGVKAVEKRDGFGPHNWGDEISSQMEEPSTAAEEGEQTPEKATQNSAFGEETQASEEEEKPKEEEKKEMTLDEYKAEQLSKNKHVFKNLRKANEGTDTKQWKKTVALERKKKGDHSDDEYEEYTDDEDVETTKSDLEKLKIQITFGDRRGRGGRGRGFGDRRGGFAPRGGGGGGFDRRGGGAGPRNNKIVPEIDNENFPSLGGH